MSVRPFWVGFGLEIGLENGKPEKSERLREEL